MKTIVGVSLTAIALIAILLLFWRRPQSLPVEVIIGIDTSGSARPRLSEYVLQASRFTARLEPGQDWLTLYRVDFETQEFYREKARGGREAGMKRFLVEVARHPERNRTLPEAFWREAERRCAQAKCPVVVLYFSDGDNDDMRAESKAGLTETAARLAQNPRVICAALIGARTSNRAYWNACFAALGDRFLVAGENEITVDAALERLEQARSGR